MLAAGAGAMLAAQAVPGQAHRRGHRHRPATETVQSPPLPPPAPAQLHGIQYLYGSAEAAALTRGVWRSLVGYVAEAKRRHPGHGVVLTAEAGLDKPEFVACGDKPPAAVFDVDETVVLNVGAEYDDLAARRPTFDDDAWAQWELTGARYAEATPGAKDALDALRAMGVTVIFNTNRSAVNAASHEALLNGLGLGPARHGDTLYLSGDDQTGSFKDARRQAIATRYCVLAMAGDQLGDFSDRFNTDPNGIAARRDAASLPGIAALWGNGWFAMPNPVYGTAIQGSADEIFPKDKQWRAPGPAARATESK